MRNVEGSKDFVAQGLRRLFEGHGVKARVRAGRVDFPAHPGLWANGELFIHSAGIAQLDVRLGGFDGERVVVESIAGFGETLEAQGNSALQAFANGSFHVLLGAFFDGELCHGTQRETWSLGSARDVYTGLVTSAVGEPPRAANGTPDLGFYDSFTESVRRLPVPAGTHWIRLYQARRANGQEVANEVLLDNETSEALQAVMAKYPWPTAEKAYDVRTFLVIKDATPDAERRSNARRHAPMVDRKRVRNLVVGASIAALLALAVLFFARSERRGEQARDLTTDTDSASIPTANARVAFIRRYVKTRGPVTDADFHVVFHDNSHGIPGPSDWSIDAVLRVNPGDRDVWLVDAAATTAPTGPRRSIPPDWGVTSQGETYRRGSTTVVWHPEGIVEIASSTF